MRFSTISSLVLLFAGTASASELLEPVPILAAGRPLDVEQMGHAAPFVADFDGSGLQDLLVGEFYRGRLRIYPNVGTNDKPQFDGYALFQDGDPSGCIHASCCMGFGPQMIDFDGDGHADIISGNWIQHVIVFRGRGLGLFSPGEPVRDQGGQPLSIGYGVSAFAVDWDGDGDLDLLAGTVEHSAKGNVYLVRNEGTAGRHGYARPEQLVADGAPIVAADGGAAPVAADWDGDGRLDLILGCGDGSVRLYRNIGTRAMPELGKSVSLVPAVGEGEHRGRSAKICVIDWNGDGHLDLLVGDAGPRFEKQLSAEEEEWREEAKAAQAAVFKEWAQLFGRYRERMAAPADIAEEERDKHKQELASIREDLGRASGVRSRFQVQEASLKSGTQTHGRVWLYLNSGRKQPPASAISVPE